MIYRFNHPIIKNIYLKAEVFEVLVPRGARSAGPYTFERYIYSPRRSLTWYKSIKL